MQIHRFALQRDMACCLLRGPMPEVVIDWVDLVFGISLPVGGRTIALLDQVSPITEQNTPKAQQHFLNGLKGIVGNKQRLVMMSDGCRAWIGILSDGWPIGTLGRPVAVWMNRPPMIGVTARSTAGGARQACPPAAPCPQS